MAQTKNDIKAMYPLPSYNYRVTVASEVISFAEVAGLSLEYEPVTYRHGLSFALGYKIIPGMRQPVRLTMKRGVVQSRDFLRNWINSVYNDAFATDTKRDIVIDLCDEVGAPVVRWTVQGAMPIKLEAPAFDASSHDVAIESMELLASSLQIDYRV
jgi:phage tail-like protein